MGGIYIFKSSAHNDATGRDTYPAHKITAIQGVFSEQNITGAATPALSNGAVISLTYTGDVTGWTFTGLASGESCELHISNPDGHTAAASGLTGLWTDSFTEAHINTDGAVVIIVNSDDVYQAVSHT